MLPSRGRPSFSHRALSSLVLFAAAIPVATCGGARPGDTPASSSQKEAREDRTVATVNGEIIKESELERAVRAELKRSGAEYEQQPVEIKKNVLEILIVEKLIEAAAKKEGLTSEQYMLREVKARSKPPSEEMIREIYEKSAEQYGESMPDYEQVREGIRQALVEQLQQEAGLALIASLREKAEVTVSLSPPPPPAVQVPTDGPSRGEPDAPVTIVEFSDYQCPFCGRAQATVERIMETYPGKIRLVFRDYPLSYHRFATKAAEAAHCAGDQGRYWEMHALLYENSYALREMDLKAYAEELGLDTDRFDSCLDSSEKAPVVQASLALVKKLDLTGAPAFFINGRLLTGALPFERFQEIIDDELRKAGE
jgi:protein-disulfide isomerase